MGVLEFIAAIVDAVAWPATAVVAFVLFRRQLAVLIPLLRRFRYKELELEFEEKLREAKKEVRAPATAARELPPDLAAEQDRLLQITSVAPRGAIMEAWVDVEREALRAVERRGITPTDQQRGIPYRLTRLVASSGIAPPELAQSLETLRNLRNTAVHAPDEIISPEQAEQYVTVSGEVSAKLREL